MTAAGRGCGDGIEEGVVGRLLLEVAVPEQRLALAAEGARDPRILVRDALTWRKEVKSAVVGKGKVPVRRHPRIHSQEGS
jgi:hypothetical protein